MEIKRRLELETIANKIRYKSLEMIRSANSGHIGGSFSVSEVLAVLYFDGVLNVDSKNPKMATRDRLILSKGHCCPALYCALAMRNFFPESDLIGFRSLNSYLSGHPDMRSIPGVDMSTGSLGQGLSVGIGMALSGKLLHQDYKTFVILGDGEIEEGQVWEAAMAANKYKLDNLIAIIDKNGLQLDGKTNDIMDMGDMNGKFSSFGWSVMEVDGHNVEKLKDSLEEAKRMTGNPVVIIANTVKGKGVSVFENEIRFHGGRPTAEEYDIAFTELNAKISSEEAEICRI